MEPRLPKQPFPTRLKRELRLLRDAPAGTRFRRRHKRVLARKPPSWVRVARILGSGLVAAAGVLLLALPGPGILVMILGLAMLAGEFAWVARMLDWLELLIREWLAAARRSWKAANGWLRALLVGAGLACLGAVAWLAVRILFD